MVVASRARNERLSVTGALMFTGTRFAQYVEGPAESIAALRSSILADPRHTDVRIRDEGARSARLFAEWALAYSGFSKPFDRLTDFAHQREPSTGSFLL